MMRRNCRNYILTMKRVVDNFLSEQEHQNLLEYIKKIQWTYYTITDDDNDLPKVDNYQFGCEVFDSNIAYDRQLVNLFSSYLKPLSWGRIKINFQPKMAKVRENKLHIDIPYGDWTSVYYVNDNDGYTFFGDGSKVESRSNRMVIFPRNTLHSGTTSTTDHRYVINFNWFGPEYKR